MEFKKERVYSAVNADKLEVGDKVIVAKQLGNLKYQVSQKNYYVWTIKEIKEDTYSDRFVADNGAFPLVYLIERGENCTNCDAICAFATVRKHPELKKCKNWKSKTEKKCCSE